MARKQKIDKGLAFALECIQTLWREGVAKNATGLSRVHVAENSPNRRQVFRIDTPDGAIALKCDQRGARSGSLTREYEALDTLSREFPQDGAFRTVRPVFVDPHGRFIATEWVDAPSARKILGQPDAAANSEMILRRAGMWLGRLHALAPFENGGDLFPFARLEMVFEKRHRKIRTRGQDLVDGTRLEAIANKAQAALVTLGQRHGAAVRGHGDFHGGNILFLGQTTIGLDCPENKNGLAEADIADFLTDLDWGRPAVAGQLSPGGVSLAAEQAFLSGYGRQIDVQALHAAMQIRLFRRLSEILKRDNIAQTRTELAPIVADLAGRFPD